MTAPGRFLERWSRLKRKEGDPAADAGRAAVPAPFADVAPTAAEAGAASTGEAEAALPALDSLDLAADFSGFMKKEVSESLRRAALRKLFSDPHFNRMDGLDIYIDDYSVSEPIPEDMMKRLRQFDTFLKDGDAAAPDGGVPAEVTPAGTPAIAAPDVSTDPGIPRVNADASNSTDAAADRASCDILAGVGQIVPPQA